VRELNAGNRSGCFQEACDARQSFDVFVLPDADVMRRNAPVGRDRASLDDHETSPAHGSTPEVDQVKIVGETVVR
jgi:uncharacterized Fe-S center protein